MDDFQNIINDSSTKTIVTGDFNIPLNINSSNTRIIISLIESSNFSRYINEPTQISRNILDLVISHNTNTLSSNHSSKLLISDHHLLTFKIHVNKPSRPLATINYRKINNNNIDSFYSDFLQKCIISKTFLESSSLYTSLHYTLIEHAQIKTNTPP